MRINTISRSCFIKLENNIIIKKERKTKFNFDSLESSRSKFEETVLILSYPIKLGLNRTDRTLPPSCNYTRSFSPPWILLQIELLRITLQFLCSGKFKILDLWTWRRRRKRNVERSVLTIKDRSYDMRKTEIEIDRYTYI